jgi:hypothetical protein
MVGYRQDGVVLLASWEFRDEIQCYCPKQHLEVFWGNRVVWGFWVVRSWFGALACGASSYVCFYILE